MARSKKKGKTILLLVGLLILLILAYVFVLQKKADDKKKDEKQTLSSVVADQVSEISYQKDGETISLVKSEGTWIDKVDSQAPINQQIVTTMLNNIVNLSAESTVTDDVSDLGEFGLDKPSIVITLTMADDSKFEVMIGDKLATETGYYAMLKDQSVVYSVSTSVFSAFNYSNVQLLVVDDFPRIDTTKIIAYDVVKDNKELIKADYDEKAANAGSYYAWKISKPYKSVMLGDPDKIKSYLSNLQSVFLNDCIEYDCKDLSQYGLDKPSAQIDLAYYTDGSEEAATTDATSTDDASATQQERKDYKLTVKVGAKVDDTYCYVQLLGTDRKHENSVYTMAINQLKEVINVKAIDYIVGFIQMVDKDTLDTLTITTKDDVYTFQVKGDADNREYLFNGKTAQESNFVSLYQTLIGVSAKGEIKGTVKDNTPVYTFEFKTTDKNTLTVKYLPYDDINYYRANVNGNEEFIVDKPSLDKVIKIVSEYTGE